MLRAIGVAAMVGACLLPAAGNPALAQAGNASNFVPELTLSYLDPDSGKRFECGDACRRFSVPAGVELELRVNIRDEGPTNGHGDIAWDLWFNQPTHPFPGFDLAPCFGEEGRLDRACWEAMVDRVDRETWDLLRSDVVCVPVLDEGECASATIRLLMDPDFEGARRPGVYHVGVWANRFSAVPEKNEFDNFVGPVRVTVEPRPVAATQGPGPAAAVSETSATVPSVAVDADAASFVVGPSSPMPYGVVTVPEEVKTSFTLTSMRSQRLLEFVPACAGGVTVEVVQTGAYENMTVQVRKVSTGKVLIEAQGKGRLRLDGSIDGFDLKDDRSFEVVVVPGQGSRGIRGSMSVSYPARLRYMVNP